MLEDSLLPPSLLPSDGWAVIAEFHPDGPAYSGPPRDVRLSPEQLEQWCQQAGLRVFLLTRWKVPPVYVVLGVAGLGLLQLILKLL